MTDNELRDLVEKTALTVQKISEKHLETEASIDRLSEKINRLFELSEETDKKMQETDRKMQETDRKMKETDRKIKETDKMIKELGKQIGGLGNKFGYFTEGLALPSMEKILSKQFKMDYIFPRAKSKILGEELEIDVLAYSNGNRNEVYVVEAKSHLTMREIEQTLKILKKFPLAFPEHANKTIYGMIVAVDASSEMKQQVLNEGLYFATIHDDHFQLKTPSHFIPKQFN